MALRLIEVVVPDEQCEELRESFSEHRVIHVWETSAADGLVTLRVLLDAEHVEGVSDLMADRLDLREDFRLFVLPVEATLPRAEDAEEDESPDDEQENDQEKQPLPERISREELYEDLVNASRLTVVYLVMVGLSTLVAAVGLVRDDVAIIIGAMVIAPLLGPNIALSLACALGDLALARRSLKAIGAGLAVAGAASLAIGTLLTVDPGIPAIASRTSPDLADVAIALAAGVAGSLAFTSGVPAVVVGVMVAVALLPPLVAAGLLIAAGEPAAATGATMLLLANVACVNLAAVATFLVQKVRPRRWWEADRARKATWVAALTWIVMLLILIAAMSLNS